MLYLRFGLEKGTRICSRVRVRACACVCARVSACSLSPFSSSFNLASLPSHHYFALVLPLLGK